MATLRCPRCQTLVSAAPGGTASCPSCGFTAQVPDLPPAPAGAPSPPPLAPPPADWPAADWTVAKPVGSAPAAPLSPVPPAAPAPSWGQRGKTVPPATAAVLAVVTLGVYVLFFWWRVSREADQLKGRRHAHGLAKAGILMAVLGGLVAAFAFVAALLQVVGQLGEDATDEEFAQALAEASPAVLAILALAGLVAVAGIITLYVAQYRSWDSIRAAELAAGHSDTVNPGLYLFLPIALNLMGSMADRVSTSIGWLFTLATFAAIVTFLALTQQHLNRLWALGVAGPAPAPAAR